MCLHVSSGQYYTVLITSQCILKLRTRPPTLILFQDCFDSSGLLEIPYSILGFLSSSPVKKKKKGKGKNTIEILMRIALNLYITLDSKNILALVNFISGEYFFHVLVALLIFVSSVL